MVQCFPLHTILELWLSQLQCEEIGGEVVWDQLTFVHVFLHSLAKLTATGCFLSEQIARRHGRDPQQFAQSRGLGAFASKRWPQEQEHFELELVFQNGDQWV